jgi:hypothetical protein
MSSGAGWAATSAAAISAMVAPWFERRRAAALAMAFNGASVGGGLFAPLWALLIAELGSAAAAAAIGGAMVVTVWWLAGRYLRPTPVGMGLAPDGDELGTENSRAPASPGERRPPMPPGAAVWRDRRFAILAGAFALGLFAQIGLVAHLFSLLAPGLGAAGAGAVVSLTTACAVAGRTLLGALPPVRADRRIAAAANFAVQVAGSFALLSSSGTSVPLLLAGCVLFGLGVGNMTSLPPLIAQAEFARADPAGRGRRRRSDAPRPPRPPAWRVARGRGGGGAWMLPEFPYMEAVRRSYGNLDSAPLLRLRQECAASWIVPVEGWTPPT